MLERDSVTQLALSLRRLRWKPSRLATYLSASIFFSFGHKQWRWVLRSPKRPGSWSGDRRGGLGFQWLFLFDNHSLLWLFLCFRVVVRDPGFVCGHKLPPKIVTVFLQSEFQDWAFCSALSVEEPTLHTPSLCVTFREGVMHVFYRYSKLFCDVMDLATLTEFSDTALEDRPYWGSSSRMHVSRTNFRRLNHLNAAALRQHLVTEYACWLTLYLRSR